VPSNTGRKKNITSMEEGPVPKIPGIIKVDEQDLVDVFTQEVSRGNTRGGSFRCQIGQVNTELFATFHELRKGRKP
jgi:hypothetical protein